MIHFDRDICWMSEQYLYRKLDAAREMDADLVIIEIDSPGGEKDATIRIAERLRDINWAHTVAYISDEAYSGAAVMALGCDDIVMASHAHRKVVWLGADLRPSLSHRPDSAEIR